eukprot:sb/3472324/
MVADVNEKVSVLDEVDLTNETATALAVGSISELVSESASEMAAKDLGNIAGSFNQSNSLFSHVTGYQPIRDQYFLIRSVPRSFTQIMINEVFQSIDDATKAKMVENVAKLASKLSEDSDAINTTSIAMKKFSNASLAVGVPVDLPHPEGSSVGCGARRTGFRDDDSGA